jgi:two-component system chemotaxis sensor kinase CheA
MSNTPRERLELLLTSLGMEIMMTQAGSDQGQFPILDLLGNIRDSAQGEKEFLALKNNAAKAWERMVGIVESGRPFQADEVAWLNDLLAQLQAQIQGRELETAPSPPLETPGPAQPSITIARKPADPAQDSLPEEAAILLNLESDADLLREFINESWEHLDNIEQGVLVLEERPDDADTLNTVFRAFHTFKGGAGFLNLIPINRLAHNLESLLDQARQARLAIDSAIIEVILQGRDVLKRFLDEMDAQLKGTKPVGSFAIATEALKARVKAILDGNLESAGIPTATAPAAKAPDSPPAPPIPVATPATDAVHQEAAPAQTPVDAPAMPSVSLAAAATPPPPEESAKAVQEKPAAKAGGADGSPAASMATVKVDTHKLDGLVDLVGELVIAQSLVAQDLRDLGDVSQQSTRNMAQLGRITKELQRVSMSMRMVPIRGAFQKMARVVRDIGAKQHKQVQLLTSGEETELDRNVVEELSDPLMHMIRNSMDHGIEKMEDRLAKGKTAVGTIWLRAYHQSGNIVVEVEDDGNGLNKDRILAKAIEKGLVEPTAHLSDEEIFNFIFAAGFSTADKITDISGRGVGMDVVRRNIEKLRGRTDVHSRLGRGTQFKIMLPLTLAIIDGLIMKIGKERFIIPTLSVRESFRPKKEMLTRVQGRGEVVNVRGQLIPLLRLYEHFGVEPTSRDPEEGIVVVAQSGATSRALLVDQLLHKQEVVIKNLGELLKHKNAALAGAAILGDGRVGLILDINALVNLQPSALLKAA